MEAVATITYNQVSRNAQPYPANALPAGGTGLSLFSAAFRGWNDVIHMARKGMDITCVDIDAEKLWDMAEIYPQPIQYHVEDAWTFASEAASEGLEWDAVTVDPFMGDAAEKARDTIWLWCLLARKMVTLTVDPRNPTWAPVGWVSYLFPRSERAAWMVMRRA